MPNGAKPQILVVDDEPCIRKSLGMLLAVSGYRYPSISIVAMSGDYHEDAVLAGIIADRFYPKGQDPHDLLTTIANLIATNPARASAPQSCIAPKLDS